LFFALFGKIGITTIVTDKYSGRSRGFGFVEMADQNEARKAIAELDGKEIQGRKLRFSEALARKDKGGAGNDRSSRSKR
jgi:RNA recognition motif-containing protein